MPSVTSNSPVACAPSVTLLSRASLRATRMHLRFDRSQRAGNFTKKGSVAVGKASENGESCDDPGGIGRPRGVYQVTRQIDFGSFATDISSRCSRRRPTCCTSRLGGACAPLDTPVIFDSPARMRWAEGMRLDRRSHTASSRHVLRCRVAIWVAETP